MSGNRSCSMRASCCSQMLPVQHPSAYMAKCKVRGWKCRPAVVSRRSVLERGVRLHSPTPCIAPQKRIRNKNTYAKPHHPHLTLPYHYSKRVMRQKSADCMVMPMGCQRRGVDSGAKWELVSHPRLFVWRGHDDRLLRGSGRELSVINRDCEGCKAVKRVSKTWHIRRGSCRVSRTHTTPQVNTQETATATN